MPMFGCRENQIKRCKSDKSNTCMNKIKAFFLVKLLYSGDEQRWKLFMFGVNIDLLFFKI